MQLDGGGEFNNHAFSDFLNSKGISKKISCPYTPEQNGLVERKHRHLVELGRSFLNNSGLPLKFWFDAIGSACFSINRLPSKMIKEKSPYEIIFGKIPDWTIQCQFGCSCFPLRLAQGGNKFDVNSSHSCFIGYSHIHKGYKCLDLSTNKVTTSRHIIFNESHFPFVNIEKTNAQTTQSMEGWFLKLNQARILPAINDLTNNPPTPSQPTPSVTNPSTNATMNQPDRCFANDTCLIIVPTMTENSTPALRQSTRTSRLPDRLADCDLFDVPINLRAAPKTFKPQQDTRNIGSQSSSEVVTPHLNNPHRVSPITLVDIKSNHEPTSVKAAQTDKNWVKAMDNEIEALRINQTWDLVPHQPGQNVVGCKWVFRLKENQDGTIDRYKARLVAKGFHQHEGLDFDHTYNPVAKAATIRTIIAIAVSRRWEMHHLDVCNAFLNGILTETVYMEQPPGYKNKNFPKHVCKLRRALYELKQAPRACYHRLKIFLEDCGFTNCLFDSSLFVKIKNNWSVYVLVYVDDFI